MRHVLMHIRRPSGFVRVDEFVTRLQSLFDHYNVRHNLGLTFEVASEQPTRDPRLLRVDAGDCTGGPSEEVRELFFALAPADMSDDEIAVLFAGELTGDAKLGCSQCPPGRRGVVVSCQARTLALPHEIAHLFLGPGHCTSTANLMFENSDGITRDPPALQPDQVEALRAGEWAMPAEGVFAVAQPAVVEAVTIAEATVTTTAAAVEVTTVSRRISRRGTGEARRTPARKKRPRAKRQTRSAPRTQAKRKRSSEAGTAKRPAKKTRRSKAAVRKGPKRRR